MTKVDIHRIVQRYISGNASDNDILLLYEWVQKDTNKALFKQLVTKDYGYSQEEIPSETTEAFTAVLDAITDLEEQLGRQQRQRQLVWRIAASFLIGILSTSFLYFQFQEEKTTHQRTLDKTLVTLNMGNGRLLQFTPGLDTLIEGNRNAPTLRVKNNTLSYTPPVDSSKKGSKHQLRVPYGTVFTVRLSDGSQIMLNAGSQLEYPAHFGNSGERLTQLTGEGFFEVATRPERPFLVESKGVRTKVYGTVFNMLSYAEDNRVEVVLVEGKVGLQNSTTGQKSHERFLNPSEKALLTERGAQHFTIDKVDVAPYISWTQGELAFENLTMTEIFKKLERKFNVQIINEDQALANRRFTGRFKKETLSLILKTIQAHSPFEYTLDNDRIRISEPPKDPLPMQH